MIRNMVSTLASSGQTARRIAWLVLFMAMPVIADTVYLNPDDFIRTTVGDQAKPAVIWLDKPLQAEVTQALGHPYPQARIRYWRQGSTTAWIMEEVGKEYPITAGFVVVVDARGHRSLARAEVLVYRETRGMEIHLPGFLKQFAGNSLAGDRLAKPIDGISGATLSVNAMDKMARLALTLDAKAR